MKYHIVYCTTNLINKKLYVGIHSTNNLDDGYLGSGTFLRKAVAKYGEENFERKILFECESRKEAKWLEKIIIPQWLVDEWGFGKYFYNKKEGGISTHKDKRPVKSLDMYGQIKHYKSMSEIEFAKHPSIVSGIKKKRIRYDKLWKYEEDNSKWIWPERIMNFGNGKLANRIKSISTKRKPKIDKIDKTQIIFKRHTSKKDKEYAKLERMKERARIKRVKEIRKMEAQSKKRLEEIETLEEQLKKTQEQKCMEERKLLPVYGPEPRPPDWLLIVQKRYSLLD